MSGFHPARAGLKLWRLQAVYSTCTLTLARTPGLSLLEWLLGLGCPLHYNRSCVNPLAGFADLILDPPTP